MSNYKGKYGPIDAVGVPIRVGDLIAYPVRRGSRLSIKTARVISWDILYDSPQPTNLILASNAKGRVIRISRPDRCVVVDESKIL